jgi:hypothetical protein
MNVNSSGSYLTNCSDALPGGNVEDFNHGFNSGTANNGNIASMTATGTQAFNRSYTYDTLNRLATMSDSNTSQSCRGLSWTYDAWGNLWFARSLSAFGINKLADCLSFAKMQNGTQKQDFISFSTETDMSSPRLGAWHKLDLVQTIKFGKGSPAGETFIASFNYATRS